MKKLLDRGDEVTAFVRDPAAFETKHDRLRTAKGDARDAESLERALAGQDAVVSAFGPRSLKKDDLQEVFMKNLVAAMEKTGVKRLVNLSAFGAGDTASQTPWVFRLFMNTVLRNLYADKNRGERMLLESKLDWINVRPGRLTNGPARGAVKATTNGKEINPLMTREDLADFMIAQLESDEWVRKSPVIGY